MGFVRVLPDVEHWLDAEAGAWSPLSDRGYVALARRWRAGFLPLVDAGTPALRGDRARLAIAGRPPADVWLFSGVRVPGLANAGGPGAAAYRAVGLRSLRRELANRLELVLAAGDLSWSCVFSHEAGVWVSECLFERPAEAEPGVAADAGGQGGSWRL